MENQSEDSLLSQSRSDQESQSILPQESPQLLPKKVIIKIKQLARRSYFWILLVFLFLITVGFIGLYRSTKSKEALRATQVMDNSAPSTLPSTLSPCLEIQEEHTHQVFNTKSSSGPNLGMPAPEYKVNPCEQKAAQTQNLEEMYFLLESKDPVVLISLAANRQLPADIQWQLYRDKDLPETWDGIGPTLYDLSEGPKEELMRQLTSNMSLDPSIAEDIVNRYINHDPEIYQLYIAFLIENPNTLKPNPAVTPLLDKLARLDNLGFNVLIADTPGLDDDTIGYLSQEISYELSDSQRQQYNPSSPLYHNYPTPNFEVHSKLLRSNDVSKEVIITHLYEIRDYRRVQISQENFAKVAGDILTDQMRDYFFASTQINESGTNEGRYTYVFDLLFHGIALNKLVSSEHLQLLIDTYADEEVKRILKEEQLKYLPTMKKIDDNLKEKYPDWHSFEISALRNALINAQENLNERI